MELRRISKDEIINFFKAHNGFFPVIRIGEMLIPQNIQDKEIQLIKTTLHELKSKDLLVVKNEGEDTYHELFSSTPDRLEKYKKISISSQDKEHRIFYSWQSDLPNSVNRGLVGSVLEDVARLLSVQRPTIIDRDTKDELGAPDIPSTIFKKIEASDVVVADISIVAKYSGKKDRNGKTTKKFTSNPNVLLELGYAFKAKGHEKIILIFNSAYGKVETLPFDLRSRRPIIYHLDESDKGERKETKESLISDLTAAISPLLSRVQKEESKPTERPLIDVQRNFVVSGSSDGHDIRVTIVNIGKEPAHDIKCRLESGDGAYVSPEKNVIPLLVPSSIAPAIDYRYSETEFFNKQIEKPRIVFSYKDSDGNMYTSGRRIIQEGRADGRYNIKGDLGEFFKQN